MKHITTFALLILFPVLLFAGEKDALSIKEDLSNLSKSFLKLCLESNAQIEQLLKEKKHCAVYAQIDKVITTKSDLAGKRLNYTYTESWTHELIEDKDTFFAQENIYKVIATIPMLTLEEKYENCISTDRTINDTEIKLFAIYAIIHEKTPEEKKIFGMMSDKIAANRIAWASQILKTLRNTKKETDSKKFHIPTSSPASPLPPEKQAERKKQIAMHYINEKRKTDLGFAIKCSERIYASALLQRYPGDASRIKQAVRNAGYEGKEVNEMLFRTLNEYPAAEFLFKRKSKK